jgi:agmatine/peptidylarginine deiminase
MTSALSPFYGAKVVPVDFVLEGGAIESDGEGTLLTTSECLLNPNRNPHLSQEEIEIILKKELGAERFLWLHHGYLSGDDTDSHIDTLARFADASTIVYVACDDEDDEHYEALKAMENELRTFTCKNGNPYKLLALPMSEPKFYNNHRLPATYANFLIVNGGVIVPTYNDNNDAKALSVIQEAFPSRRIVGVDCSVLIREHGSLHCVTMQFSEKLAIINSNTF